MGTIGGALAGAGQTTGARILGGLIGSAVGGLTAVSSSNK